MSEFALDLTDAEVMIEKYTKVVEKTTQIAELMQENAEKVSGIFKLGSFADNIGSDLNLYTVKTGDYAATANVMYQFMSNTYKTTIDTDKLIAKAIYDQMMNTEPTDEESAQIQQYAQENPQEASEQIYQYVKDYSEGDLNEG